MSVAISLETMSTAEKLELMERLWADLTKNAESFEPPEWHKEVLAERSAAIDRGEVKFEDWEVVKKRLRERFS